MKHGIFCTIRNRNDSRPPGHNHHQEEETAIGQVKMQGNVQTVF
jgi:hypothetical protein